MPSECDMPTGRGYSERLRQRAFMFVHLCWCTPACPGHRLELILPCREHSPTGAMVCRGSSIPMHSSIPTPSSIPMHSRTQAIPSSPV